MTRGIAASTRGWERVSTGGTSNERNGEGVCSAAASREGSAWFCLKDPGGVGSRQRGSFFSYLNQFQEADNVLFTFFKKLFYFLAS